MFTAWVETFYHPRVHAETGTQPLRRWTGGVSDPLRRSTPAQLWEAFLCGD